MVGSLTGITVERFPRYSGYGFNSDPARFPARAAALIREDYNGIAEDEAIIIECHYRKQKWLRKSEQGDKWNRCLIEGMIVLSETGARDEQTTPP